MSTEHAIQDSIDAAADAVGFVWPLHSFVTTNPLAGFEDQPFHEAVADAERLYGGDGYPSADVFRHALEAGQIDPEVLRTELAANGYDRDPDASLERMAAATSDSTVETATTATDRVDAVLTKWLAAFLDQGQAGWPMPNREQGFYTAFRTVARYDSDIPSKGAVADLPEQPVDAIRDALAGRPVGEWRDVFEFQLAALPGWTGLIKQRADATDAWQSTYPITLSEYLAVRLTLVDLFDAPFGSTDAPDGTTGTDGSSHGDEDGDEEEERLPLPEVWLTAWETTYRTELVGALSDASESLADAPDGDRPDAQFVFCIDTRSEIIRRHIEAAGAYETHGYAGFFGIPMRYAGHGSDVTVDACPPILDAQHYIADRPVKDVDAGSAEHDRWHTTLDSVKSAIESLKTNATTAFSFVESAGVGYGAALAARTLLPARVYDLFDTVDRQVPDAHEFCEPRVDYTPDPSPRFGLASRWTRRSSTRRRPSN